ncbi:MAG: metalloregulator ArsR/SmtB family transcription factor [archaeon]
MISTTVMHDCCSKGYEEQEVYGAYKIFFGTLVSQSRLQIINLLRKGKMNVSEIVKELKADQSAVSHDLARLRECGFVKITNDGKYRYYSLNEETIKPLMTLIDKHMAANCIHILRKREGKE